MKRFLCLVLAFATGCSDALEQDTTAGQVVAVVNTDPATLSLVSATDFRATDFDLLNAAGRPAAIAGRMSVVAAPLPGVDSVVFLDFGLGGGSRRVALASGAGAAGIAIADDSIAWVANPNNGRATRINYRTGDTSTIAVGPTPEAVVITRGTLYVVNANGSVSWRTLGAGAGASGTIVLTGLDPEFATVGGDSLVYVVSRGAGGAADGKLSIVDPATNQEAVVINGLGERPGPPVFHPSGRLLIASEQEGILEVNALTRSLVRGPGTGVKPGGNGVAALALDQRGRIYALDRGNCTGPGVVHVLSAPPNYAELRAVAVGVCPSAAAPVLMQAVP
jgi:streptogramin lyase